MNIRKKIYIAYHIKIHITLCLKAEHADTLIKLKYVLRGLACGRSKQVINSAGRR